MIGKENSISACYLLLASLIDMDKIPSLIILVADLDIENCVREVILRLQSSKEVLPFQFKIVRHPLRDPGCYSNPQEYLRSYLHSHQFGMVLLDRDGSGKEKEASDVIESTIASKLDRNGWMGRSACMVIEPEIENWLWVASDAVAKILGWSEMSALRAYLESNGFWPNDISKPPKPKEAIQFAMRKSGTRFTPAIHQSIAAKASFKSCSSPSFQKFKDTIVHWYRENQ